MELEGLNLTGFGEACQGNKWRLLADIGESYHGRPNCDRHHHRYYLEVVLNDDGGSSVVDAVSSVLPHQLLLLRLEELPVNRIWIFGQTSRV